MYHACLELFEATSLNGVLQYCVPKDLQGCDWEAYTNGEEMFSGDPSYWGWNGQVVHVYFTAPQFTYTGDRIPRSSCLSLHSRHAAKIAELMQLAKDWTTPPMHGDGWGQSAPTRPLLPYRPWLTKKSALCAMFAFWAGLGIRLSMDPIDSIQSTRRQRDQPNGSIQLQSTITVDRILDIIQSTLQAHGSKMIQPLIVNRIGVRL